MSIRLDFDTRKVQKYIKCKENDVWWGQNHVFCYIFKNMEFRWFMLNQSWVEISYDGLENILNDSHVNKAWFWQQEGAKIRQMQRLWSLRGSKSHLMLFKLKYGIHIAHIAPNLEYWLVVMIWKTNCIILMSTRLDFDTRKVQKYIKCKEIDL